jgi:hypothetical protein
MPQVNELLNDRRAVKIPTHIRDFEVDSGISMIEHVIRLKAHPLEWTRKIISIDLPFIHQAIPSSPEGG